MRGELIAHYQTLGRPRRPSESRCPANGKRGWATEDEALTAAWEFGSRNRFVFDSHTAYQCEHCHDWHLSSKGARR